MKYVKVEEKIVQSLETLALGIETITFQWRVMNVYVIEMRIQTFSVTQKKTNCEKSQVESRQGQKLNSPYAFLKKSSQEFLSLPKMVPNIFGHRDQLFFSWFLCFVATIF